MCYCYIWITERHFPRKKKNTRQCLRNPRRSFYKVLPAFLTVFPESSKTYFHHLDETISCLLHNEICVLNLFPKCLLIQTKTVARNDMSLLRFFFTTWTKLLLSLKFVCVRFSNWIAFKFFLCFTKRTNRIFFFWGLWTIFSFFLLVFLGNGVQLSDSDVMIIEKQTVWETISAAPKLKNSAKSASTVYCLSNTILCCTSQWLQQSKDV